RFDNPIAAPIAKGQEVATLVVTVPDRPPVELPLTAGRDVKRLGLIGRLGTALKAIVWGESG
ncbi:MAG: D-alanyl-D-alanine carboxypeptidase, partial [Rhodospirillales bacterium]